MKTFDKLCELEDRNQLIDALLAVPEADYEELEAAALRQIELLRVEHEETLEACKAEGVGYAKFSMEDNDRRRREISAAHYGLMIVAVRYDELPQEIEKAFFHDLNWFGHRSVMDFYLAHKPGWLNAALNEALGDEDERSRYRSVSLGGDLFPYVIAGVFPRPAEGHNYYQLLAAAMQRHFKPSSDELGNYLIQDTTFVEKDLPAAIRWSSKDQNKTFGSMGFSWNINTYDNLRTRNKSYFEMTVNNGQDTVLARFDRVMARQSWDKGEQPEPEWVNESPEAKFYWQDGELPKSGDLVPSELTLALRSLGGDGRINLESLLSALLDAVADQTKEALSREFRRAFGYIVDGNDSLILSQFDRLLTLLANPFPPVVRFALEHLEKVLDQLGSENANLLLDEFAPVFTHVKSKPVLICGIEILGKVSGICPEQRERVIELIAPVLSLPAANIQKAVFIVLGDKPDKSEEHLKSLITVHSGSIVGTMRKKFAPWTEDESIAEELLVPVSAEPIDPPFGEPVEPLVEVEDVVFVANELLSGKIQDPIDVERFLDGLARVDEVNRGALIAGFKAFEKRVPKVKKDGWMHGPVKVLIAEIVEVVLGRDESGSCSIEIEEYSGGPLRFQRCRVNEVLSAFTIGKGDGLLACPETDLGYLSFATLEQRVHGTLAVKSEIMLRDFVQAIARWDGRNAELSQRVNANDAEPLRVLSYFADGVVLGTVETAEWWVTAARMRDPMCYLRDVDELRHLAEPEITEWSEPWESNYPEKYPDGTHNPNGASVYKRREYNEENDAVIFEALLDVSFKDNEIRRPSKMDWMLSSAPGHLEPFLGKSVGKVTVEALAKRRLKVSFPYARHMVQLLVSEDRVQREAAPELWLIAEQDGQMDEGMSPLRRALWIGCNTTFESWFQMNRVVPSLRAVADLDPRLKSRVRDLILGVLEDGICEQSDVLGKINGLIKLVLDLSMETSLKNANFDFTKLESVPLPKAAAGTLKKLKKQLG